MSRVGIIVSNGIYIANTIENDSSQIVIPEKAEILTKLYEQLTQNFLDILILKKLKERKMRLCELSKSLKKEFFISIDAKKLHKTIKEMKKEKIVAACGVGSKKFYCLTNKGRKIIEILQKQQYRIHEMVLNVVSS